MSFSAVGQHGAVRHRDPTMRQLMKLKEECQEKDIPAFVTEGIDKAMALFQVWHCIRGPVKRFEPVRERTNNFGSDHPVQSQKLARSLKFRI